MPSRVSPGATRRLSRVFTAALALGALGGCQLIDGIDGKTFVEAAGAAGLGGQGGNSAGGSAGTTSGSGGVSSGSGGVSGGSAGTDGGSAGATGGSAGATGGSAGTTGGSAGMSPGGASGAAGSGGGPRPSWAQYLGTTDLYESITSVRVTADGIFALGLSTPAPASNPDTVFVARFTLDGALVWAKNYRQLAFNTPTDLEVVNGVIAVTGTTYEDGGPGHFWLFGLDAQDGSVRWQMTSDDAQSPGVSIWGLCPQLDGSGVIVGLQRGLDWKGFQKVSTSITSGLTSFPAKGTFFAPKVAVNKSVYPEHLRPFGSLYLYTGSYDSAAGLVPLSSAFKTTFAYELLPPAGGAIYGDALPVVIDTGNATISYGARSTSGGPFKLYAFQNFYNVATSKWAYEFDLDVDPISVRAVQVSDGYVLVASRTVDFAPTPLLVKLDKDGVLQWSKLLGIAFSVSSIAAVPGTASVVLGGATCDAGVTGCKKAGNAALVRVRPNGSIDDYASVSSANLVAQNIAQSLTQNVAPAPPDVFTQGTSVSPTIAMEIGTMKPLDWSPKVGPLE